MSRKQESQIAEWAALIVVLMIMVAVIYWGPTISYKILYEDKVRDTVREVLGESH